MSSTREGTGQELTMPATVDATGQPRQSVANMAYAGVGKFVFVITLGLLLVGAASARDDGRYANSPLKGWFDSLKSGLGPCCSDADGFAVSDPDWESRDGRYRVRIDGNWIVVPDDALITEPNRYGRTMVWP